MCRDTSAIDPQLSPNGLYVAFVVSGEIYVQKVECSVPVDNITMLQPSPPTRMTFGAMNIQQSCITHGLADFLSQEEMDRYRGFWWTLDSKGLVFAEVDESDIPIYRIAHQGLDGIISCSSSSGTPIWPTSTFEESDSKGGGHDADLFAYEDHRYPFAGCANPRVRLGYLPLPPCLNSETEKSGSIHEKVAEHHWKGNVKWFAPPTEASEYLARMDFLPDGSALAQWQNRAQNVLLGVRMDLDTGLSHNLFRECAREPNHWINLHHLYKPLNQVYTPPSLLSGTYSTPMPEGSFSFLFGSERSGFLHLYLYTYVGMSHRPVELVRAVTAGPWMVEDIVGVNEDENVLYVTGTYDSPLERHLYVVPLIAANTGAAEENDDCLLSARWENFCSSKIQGVCGLRSINNADDSALHPHPICLTNDAGMHNITMDCHCRYIVNASSDLDRPPSIKVYSVRVPPWWVDHFSTKTIDQSTASKHVNSKPSYPDEWLSLMFVLHDASHDEPNIIYTRNFAPPELISFPSSDGAVELHGALYLPDSDLYGPGPYPLACAVYGGPHVQRVHRSYSQCIDMRAQRLRSLGFAIIKCDNRGSSRRGVAFENAISRRLGRVEVMDQVTAVQYAVNQGIADPSRVGIYGWSYGGYLAAMCLCLAPNVFRVAVAGAPVTSWDGYDTHYTERYMGLPEENPAGFKSSAIFEYVPQLQPHQKLMIVHGLIDENVHFRHTARLINRLVANGKEYDLLLFPDERHSPRRLRDRIYMEQRISDYFLRHLMNASPVENVSNSGTTQKKGMAVNDLRPIRGNL